MRKKEGLLIFSIFLIVSSLFFINASVADEACFVVPRVACVEGIGNDIMVGLSSDTNAHGEFKSYADEDQCLGTATACDVFNDNAGGCDGQEGCDWTAGSDPEGGGDGPSAAFLPLTGYVTSGTCSGIPDTCSSLGGSTNQLACESQVGCSYEIEYDYVLCCDFGNELQPNECNNQPVFLKLSSDTNAHVGGPLSSQYENEVCYGDLDFDCIVAGSNPDDAILSPTLSFSVIDNAHFGVPDPTSPYHLYCPLTYENTHIGDTWCGDEIVQHTFLTGGPNDQGIEEQCEVGDDGCIDGTCQCDVETHYFIPGPGGGCRSILAEAGATYWARPLDNQDPLAGPDWLGEIESPTTIVVGETVWWLILRGSGYETTDTPEFTIYDRDLGFDDEIKTVTGTVNADGDVSASWIITHTDIEATNEEDFTGLTDGFYFELLDGYDEVKTSSALKASIAISIPCDTVTMCMDYKTEEKCNNDAIFCNVAPYSVAQNSPETDCTDDEIGCMCFYEEFTGECNPKWNVLDELGRAIGSCEYNEDATGDLDGCGDNFLRYSWTSDWGWDADNTFGDGAQCASIKGGACIQDNRPDVGDNQYHYDPENKYLECVGGENVVPCPAKIKLSFFNIYNLIAVVIIIAIIYWILNSKKKKVKKRSKKKKRK